MRLIILDRDGVINEDSDAYIKSPEEWRPIPGSLEAIARICHAGYHVCIATNQSGIGRRLFSIDTLNRIHDSLHRRVQAVGGHIDMILFCPDSDDHNPQRKPNPGMLVEIGQRLNIDLQQVPMVGDALRDIQAARAVLGRPMLVRTGKGEDTLRRYSEQLGRIEVYDDLAHVVDTLISEMPA